MEEIKTKYNDDIFKVPYDIVKLPSEGKLYGGTIPSSLEVEYVTAVDEDILYSDTVEGKSVFDILITEKIKNKDIDINKLLLGDYNQILMFLRMSAFGNIYQANTFDPDKNELVKYPVDLTKLKQKPIGASFDENGEFEFVLPTMNKRINFKLITVEMSNYINKTAQANINKVTGVKPYIVTRLQTEITAVEGDRDKIYISKFAKVMVPSDRLAFMQYVDEISPAVDLNYEFLSSIKKTPYTEKVNLGIDFFYPKSPISNS